MRRWMWMLRHQAPLCVSRLLYTWAESVLVRRTFMQTFSGRVGRIRIDRDIPWQGWGKAATGLGR